MFRAGQTEAYSLCKGLVFDERKLQEGEVIRAAKQLFMRRRQCDAPEKEGVMGSFGREALRICKTGGCT